MKMFHGSGDSEITLHLGLCLAENDDAAADYGRYCHEGWLHTVDVDLDGLTVLDLDGYDHDANTAPGDAGEDFGADVIIFDDETVGGRQHITYRLMTPAALAAVTVISAGIID